MIKQRNTFLLGIFLFIMWIFFGIPTSWKIFLTLTGALYLIIISIKINIPKRGTVKRLRKKEKVTPVFVENSPIQQTPRAAGDSIVGVNTEDQTKP